MDKDVVISLYVLMGALKKAVQNQEKKPTTKSDHIDIIMSNLCQLSTSSKEELNISWTEMKIDLLKTINAFDDHLNINLTVLKVFDIGCKYGLHVSPAITGIFRSKLILDS